MIGCWENVGEIFWISWIVGFFISWDRNLLKKVELPFWTLESLQVLIVQMQLKERAEKLENWRMKETKREEKKKEKKELLHRKSSLWIDESELEKKILEAIVDTTPLWFFRFRFIFFLWEYLFIF